MFLWAKFLKLIVFFFVRVELLKLTVFSFLLERKVLEVNSVFCVYEVLESSSL